MISRCLKRLIQNILSLLFPFKKAPGTPIARTLEGPKDSEYFKYWKKTERGRFL